MPLQSIRITAADTRWHRPFFDLVARVFDGLDFSLWAERGGWDSRYDVFAMVDGGRVVASIGRSRMRLMIGGEECAGFQLGAVATDPEWRGQGLSASLMIQVLDEAGDAPVILFANESVLDFYPRFGFRRVYQHRFTAPVAMEPGGSPPQSFVLDEPDERARLAAVCRVVRTVRGAFDARDYCSILLWHLTYRPLRAFWLGDAFVVVSESDGCVTVHECLARDPLALEAVLPRVIARQAKKVKFGFNPTGWWSGPFQNRQDDEALLFVHGESAVTGRRFRFPDLAQT